MQVVLGIAYAVVLIFFVCLLGRLVISWIQVFSRDWRPRGPVLVIAEGLFTVTDPPLKAVRRVLPPISLGGVRLDLGFLVVAVLCSVLLSVLSALAGQI